MIYSIYLKPSDLSNTLLKVKDCFILVFNYERNESVLNEVLNNIKSFIELEENYRTFYKADEILIFRRKFDEMIETIYDDAKRRHVK
jgi:hypothetical protein